MRIVIAPLCQGKLWSGRTIYEESLGGSESAVIYLARSFARMGHRVRVYSSGMPGTYDDVEYRPQNRIAEVQGEPIDVFIASRWMETLQLPQRAKVKVLWLHDNLWQGWMCPYPVSFVVTLSGFHKSQFSPDGNPDHAPEGVVIIGNGVDTSLFQGEEERDINRLIWTSNPDRGLYVAGRIFQLVRKEYPELELHVFGRSAVYGWDQSAEAVFQPDDLTNIFYHDPLAKAELARELMRSWAWWYPHHWAESYSIAALESQCAGAVPISNPLAALSETVRNGETGILTWKMEEAVRELREKPEVWQRMSDTGKAYANGCDWDERAKRWMFYIEQSLEAQKAAAVAPQSA